MPDYLRGSYGPVTVNWRGFYLGGQAGYGSSDANLNGSNSSMLAALISDDVIQQMGVAQWNLGLGKDSARAPGYGAFTGYNWQWDDVVAGVEMSYLHGSFGGKSTAFKELVGGPLSDNFFHDVSVTSSSAISISDMATFRARAAYAWGCFLPYAFAGFALGNANITQSVLVTDAVSLTRFVHSANAPVCGQCHPQSPDLWLHGRSRHRHQSVRRSVHARGVGVCPFHGHHRHQHQHGARGPRLQVLKQPS
jgi:hypothetical protein